MGVVVTEVAFIIRQSMNGIIASRASIRNRWPCYEWQWLLLLVLLDLLLLAAW